jgi:hypothetical protein
VSLALSASVLSLGQKCIAGLWRPSPHRSWSATSANGKYVFANVSTLSVDEQLKESNEGRDELVALESTIRDVHERFPVTGMYANDGSRTPLWTFPMSVYRGTPSADGKRLVALGEGAHSSTCFDLVNVYEANGAYWEVGQEDVVPMLEWMIRRLCSNDVTYDTIDINSAGDRLTIATNCGDVVEFSLVDRSVFRRKTFRNTVRIVMGSWSGRLALLAIVILVATFAWKAGRRRDAKVSARTD